MGFFNRFVWVFLSPSKLFQEIKEGKAPWWQAWIWISLMTMVAGYFMLPVSVAVMELNPQDLPLEQVDQQIDFVEKYGLILLAVTPVGALVQYLIAFGLGYILVSVLCQAANFKKFFTIGLYASIVANVASLLNVLIVHLRGGVDAIDAAADAEFSIGLGFLAPEDGVFLKSLLLSVEFFAVWALVLVAMGLMKVFDMPQRHAVYCVIPLWLLLFGQRLLQVAFGGIG